MRSRPFALVSLDTIALVLAALGWVLLAPESGARAGGLFPYDDPAALALGKPLYAEHCASCHGAALEGEANWRQPDAEGYLPAPPHDETGHTWHHPDAQLFAITKHGTAALVGGDYKTRMEGFGDSLTDAEILAILAYVKSTWPPQIIARHNQVNAAQP